MNTLHLKYAVEVERTRSITQAAENLFMAQPNLSKAIKELEDTLGIEIFERTPKGVVPTPKGAEFLEYAKNVLDQINRMEQLCKPKDARQSFKISIPRSSYIAQAFTRFVAELNTAKGMEISVQETNSMQAISNVTDEGFPLGIIRYQTDYENYFLDYLEEKKLVAEPVWEFKCLALMSRNHPLASAKKVTLKDLAQSIEIAHGDTAIPYLPAGKVKKSEAKKCIYVNGRCSQFDLLSSIPRTYMWASPVPDHFLNLYGLVQRRCHDANYRYKDMLIYPRGYQFTELDQQFIGHLRAIIGEMESRKYV